MMQRLVNTTWSSFRDKFLYTPRIQERLGRQTFFYNAFRALAFNGIDGNYAEFGSWGARTFTLAYHESRRHKRDVTLWSFDSFEGLPTPKGPLDAHPEWKPGAMSMSLERFHKACATNGIPRAAYHVVPGYYDDTLTKLSSTDEPTNIALAYIDCDLHSSTKTVLEFLRTRFKHGMIVAFDDYFCWAPSELSGERRAMLEFLDGTPDWELVPYIQFGWHGQSFMVEDKRLRFNPDPG